MFVLKLDDRTWFTFKLLQRKRRCDPPPPQAMKKFCPDTPMGSDGNWSSSLAHSSATNVQGPPDFQQWLNRYTLAILNVAFLDTTSIG